MFVHSPALPPLDYAAAAVVGPGSRLVLSAGACPLGSDGTVVAPGDVAAQARKVLENVRTALTDAGACLDDVVRLTVYVASADRADLVAAWTETGRRSTRCRRPPCWAWRCWATPSSWWRSTRWPPWQADPSGGRARKSGPWP